MIFELRQPEKAALLFEGWQETMVWSCLQNVMGRVYAKYADSGGQPTSAMALLGDFCFLAGQPDPELVLHKPDDCHKDFIIMIPHGAAWESLIEHCYKEKARRVVRYALKKEPDMFPVDALRQAACTLPAGDIMQMLDRDLFARCQKTKWCRDWVSQYASYEMFQEYGLGVAVLRGEEIVAGASSYSGYRYGIEIQIDTKEEFRRQGLAYACGARLILECQKRGWYPSWDAQNQWSLALAEKLGYRYDHAYFAYEIWGY